MDDVEWWASCEDPDRMLSHVLEGKASGRKLRLFACACVRSSWALSYHDNSVLWDTAIELAERFADGDATAGALEDALKMLPAAPGQVARWAESLLEDAAKALDPGKDPAEVAREALEATVSLESRDPDRGYVVNGWWSKAGREKCNFLRDIFLPPAPPVLPPAWLAWNAGAIPKMARAVYEGGPRFAHTELAVLADALEDAGCDEERILDHCRGWSPAEHCRGCWVVDLILDKG
jgi:hypothetical protein